MHSETHPNRAIAFFDGQNLFYAAKEAFGHSFPNYDPAKLAQTVCNAQGWDLVETRFYTGFPDAADHLVWNHFWTAKLGRMGREGIATYARPLRYRNESIPLPDGTALKRLVGSEKGIDVRIALDIVRHARLDACDVVLVFSQDQDLSEVADEVRAIAQEHGRWIKMASAFPTSPASRNTRGVNGTDWIRIDRATYDACLDPTDYRPKTP